jgi:hypothetical protein
VAHTASHFQGKSLNAKKHLGRFYGHQRRVGEGAPRPAGHRGDQQGAVVADVGLVAPALVDWYQDGGPPAVWDCSGGADALENGVQARRDVGQGIASSRLRQLLWQGFLPRGRGLEAGLIITLPASCEPLDAPASRSAKHTYTAVEHFDIHG